MSKGEVTVDVLGAMASLSGLDLGGDGLDALLPQLARAVEAVDTLDALDLEGVEPAVAFKAGAE